MQNAATRGKFDAVEKKYFSGCVLFEKSKDHVSIASLFAKTRGMQIRNQNTECDQKFVIIAIALCNTFLVHSAAILSCPSLQ